MLHCGMGGADIDGLFGCLNIPPISQPALKQAETTSGEAIQCVAEESMQAALEEELERTRQ